MKNELGEYVSEDAFGVKTYVPTNKELEDLGFDVDQLFLNELKFISSTGNLEFRISNCGTNWKVFLAVKNGMFCKTETCWPIHPQSSDEVKMIIRSFTAQFVHRNNGIH
jgi:hypothetical protein